LGQGEGEKEETLKEKGNFRIAPITEEARRKNDGFKGKENH
jgi:hypothetical protein